MFLNGNTSTKDGAVSSFSINIIVVHACMYAMYTSLCQLINIFGIVTNVINIICFVKQGFKDTVNISLLGMTNTYATFFYVSYSLQEL